MESRRTVPANSILHTTNADDHIFIFFIITSLVRFFSEQEAADHLVSLLLLVLLLLHRVRREGGMKMARMIYM